MKRTFLESLVKDATGYTKCPRCGGELRPKQCENALSRHADIYICADCGSDEAVLDMVGQPLPYSEWKIAQELLADVGGFIEAYLGGGD